MWFDLMELEKFFCLSYLFYKARESLKVLHPVQSFAPCCMRQHMEITAVGITDGRPESVLTSLPIAQKVVPMFVTFLQKEL